MQKYVCIFFCFRTFEAIYFILRKKIAFFSAAGRDASAKNASFFYVLPNCTDYNQIENTISRTLIPITEKKIIIIFILTINKPGPGTRGRLRKGNYGGHTDGTDGNDGFDGFDGFDGTDDGTDGIDGIDEM